MKIILGEARKDVVVQVRNGLHGFGAIIDKEMAGLGAGDSKDGAGDAREARAKGGQGLRGSFHDGGVMIFRDDDGVAANEGADVEEREDGFIFVDFEDRDLTGDDFTEDAVGIGGHGSLQLGGPGSNHTEGTVDRRPVGAKSEG